MTEKRPLNEEGAELSQSSLIITLVAAWFVLIAASAIQDLLNFGRIAEARFWILDVEVESGLYTWFSTIILAIASMSIGFIALEKKIQRDRLRFHWVGLFLIFLILSVDESCSIHEAISAWLSSELDTDGLFHFAWIIPAIVLCFIGLIVFIPFIASFPGRLRVQLLLSAAGFLLGAIGMEMLAGVVAEQSVEAIASPSYRTLATIEEALEGGAVILFISVLFRYAMGSGKIHSPFAGVGD